VIDKYGAYVATVAHNIIGAQMTYEDVEEISSDVFTALWRNADKVHAGKLKAYLGSIARNKAKNLLRGRLDSLPLEDDILIADTNTPEDEAIIGDERRAVRLALDAMPRQDRDIFLRHYYGLQSVQTISEQTGLGVSAVKQRLARGREKLRTTLERKLDK
jgi:RNA polymerase sigma-70 factor (ECF subfamily)